MIAIIRSEARLDHWRLCIALTLNQSELWKPLAVANGRCRQTNRPRGGHNFLLKVIKEGITFVEAFSKGGRAAHLTRILLKSEVKILPRHISFFLSECPVDLLLVLVLGFS